MNSEHLKKLILDRRTVHNYKNKPIEQSIINDATECFLHAPNHHNTRPWKLLNSTRIQKSKLAEFAIELKSKKKSLSDIEKQAVHIKYSSPSHLIIVMQTRCSDERQSKEDYAAIACAMMNMKLFLWSKEIGTKWSSGSITKSDKTYELFNIDKNKMEIVGFLWAGYFDRKPIAPKKEKPDEVWL